VGLGRSLQQRILDFVGLADVPDFLFALHERRKFVELIEIAADEYGDWPAVVRAEIFNVLEYFVGCWARHG
jgi:hypothetical protein